MGKYNYSRNISFTKFYGNYVYYFHNQLTIKPMNITHGKTTHLVGLNQAQASLSTKPSWVKPAHTQIPANWKTRELLSQISAKMEYLELPPIKPQLV